MTKKSCVIYDSWADQIINLPKEMAGEYIQAMLKYAIYGEDMDVDDPAIKAMLVPVRKKLDEDRDKYQEQVDRMNRNRQKSQRSQDEVSMTSDRSQNEVASDTDTVSVSVNDKDIKDKKEKRFSKPSVDEVRAYCQERHNDVDPDTFIDFYESKGWKVGNQSMKDWKACVRTWEKRGSPAKKPNIKFHDFNERKLDYAELEKIAMGETR